MKGQQAAAIIGLIICLLIPTSAFAQDTEESGLNIRERIAALVERFVTQDEAATSAEPDPVTADETAETEAAPLDPTLVSGIVGGVAIAAAVILLVRGYQPPSKADPFRSRW